jgi:hypothetical protein
VGDVRGHLHHADAETVETDERVAVGIELAPRGLLEGDGVEDLGRDAARDGRVLQLSGMPLCTRSMADGHHLRPQ